MLKLSLVRVVFRFAIMFSWAEPFLKIVYKTLITSNMYLIH